MIMHLNLGCLLIVLGVLLDGLILYNIVSLILVYEF